METRALVARISVALVVGLSACSDPYADRPPTSPLPAVSVSPRVQAVTPEAGDARPAEPAPAPFLRGRRPAGPSAERLARGYARSAINWDWRTLPERLAALRPLTAGPLSAELGGAMAAAKADESLARDRPASQGTVVAVMVSGNDSSRRLVVVTRERETAGGAEPLHGATHRVYLGEVRRVDGGWRMVGWSRAP